MSLFSQQVQRCLATVALAAACLCGGMTSQALAADTEITVDVIEVGLHGSFKLGRWTPIEFEVKGPAGQQLFPVIRTADPDGLPLLQRLAPITLDQSPVRVRGLFKSGRLEGAIQVQLYDHESLDLHAPVFHQTVRAAGENAIKPTIQSTQIWVSLSPQPTLSRSLPLWNSNAFEVVRYIELKENSGEVWSALALDGVDVVVLNADTFISETTSLSLEKWVRNGGRLLLSIGEHVPQLQENPIAKWLPFLPTGRINISKLSGLNDIVSRSSTLRTLTSLPAAQLDRKAGTEIVSGLSEPIALRSAYGGGMVTVLAIRLDALPLQNWEPQSQVQLASTLAGMQSPQEAATLFQARAEAAAELNPVAVTDLQLQLNQSLDHYDQVNRPSHWQVIGWVALIALVVGPLDYLLVSKLLKRPALTWISVTAISFLLAAVTVSHGTTQNQAPVLSRQFDLVDLDVSTKQLRVNSWFGFYSDQTQRVELKVSPAAALVAATPTDESLNLSFSNQPNTGLRGMYRTGGIAESQPAYHASADHSTILNLPVKTWSTASAYAESQAILANDFPIKTSLNESGINRLTGTIEHQLNGEITDWFVAYQDFAFFDRSGEKGGPIPLKPGQPWDISRSGTGLLRSRLQSTIEQLALNTEFVDREAAMTRLGYNPLSRNTFMIGLTTSFYQLLGGEKYTKLQNQSLQRLDLSQHLGLNRAVLIGKVKSSSLAYQVDSQTLETEQHDVVVRIVIPVAREERSSDAPPSTDILNYRR